MLFPGSPKLGWLSELKNSERNCKPNRPSTGRNILTGPGLETLDQPLSFLFWIYLVTGQEIKVLFKQ